MSKFDTDEEKPVVMVADSDSNVRDLVGRFITEAGYSAVYAHTGYEALDSARKSPPLAILADILLPKLDGLALCRLIKGDPETSNIVTVIIISILSSDERAKKAGADAFVQKPLEKTRILNTLREAVERRKK
jgi:CheY-like chemotaxis protein